MNIANNTTNFSGSNAYVRLNDTTLLEPTNFSIEAWIKPSSVPTNDAIVFISPQSGTSENSTNGYDLFFGGSNGFHPGDVSFTGAGC